MKLKPLGTMHSYDGKRGAGVNNASGSVDTGLKAFKKKPSGARDSSWSGQGKYK